MHSTLWIPVNHSIAKAILWIPEQPSNLRQGAHTPNIDTSSGFHKSIKHRRIEEHICVKTKGYSTDLLDPTQVESKKCSQIQWPVPSINAEPVDIFLGEE